MTNKNQSKSDKKTRKYKKRRAQLKAEVAQLNKEWAEQRKKTDKEFEELGKKIREVAELQRVISEQQKKTDEQLKKTDEQLKKTDEQIGGLGNKFGGYTEAMAMPSIRGILERDFDADFEGWFRAGDTKHGVDLEVDAWGVSRNGTGAAYLVEIKSKFRHKHIKQVWQLVERFRIHKSEYRKRAVYPMLAVVDISDAGRATVWNAGIHLIEINDGVFQYAKPPQDFEADGYHGLPGVRKDVPHLRAVPGSGQKRRGTG